MASNEEIHQQQERLAIYRRTLAQYLRQRATLSESYCPPGIINGIAESREDIRRVKAILRNWGIRVQDHPDDNETYTAPVAPPLLSTVDWGEAPAPDIFYGRQAEQDTLLRWIVDERCRLIGVFGVAGIGKTLLSALITKQVSNEFEFVFWRSILNKPPLGDVLNECLLFLSGQQYSLSDSLDKQINQFIAYLRAHRCLIVFDNYDAVLQSGEQAGHPQPNYEDYERLIERVGASSHQSCLLLTSRVHARSFTYLEAPNAPTRALSLGRLSASEARAFIAASGVSGGEDEWSELLSHYTAAGNPLHLKIVAGHIRDLFGGDIGSFLQARIDVPTDISAMLDYQIDRQSPLGTAILYWLAIARAPILFVDLRTALVPTPSVSDLQASLHALRDQFLIETGPHGFTLQYVIMEHLTDHLVRHMVDEISAGTVALLHRYPLLLTQAKEHIREIQRRLLITPICTRLREQFPSEAQLIAHLRQLLDGLPRHTSPPPSYAGGTMLNLLRTLNADLTGLDCSDLAIWQADLQYAVLHDARFVGADVSRSIFNNTFGSVLAVALSPDGALLAAGTTNGEIRFWRTNDYKPVATFTGHTDWVNTVAFSPDGRLLASGSDDKTIRLWDIATRECVHVLRDHDDWIWSVTFSPHGVWLASAGSDKMVRVWDIHTGACLYTLAGHTDQVRSVAFNAAGTLLASGSDDRTIRIWSCATWVCQRVLTGSENWVWAVAFSPTDDLVAGGSWDQTVRLWDATTGTFVGTLRAHTDRVWAVTFSRDGRRLASGSTDRTVRIWDVATRTCQMTLTGHTNRVNSIVFSLDDTVLISGNYDQTIRVWELASGDCLTVLRGFINPVMAGAISPDGKIIASASDDQRIRLWDAKTGTARTILAGHGNRVMALAFSPNGALLASGGANGTARLWDAASGHCRHVLEGHTGGLRTVAFSPDGSLLASGSEDGTVRLWDVVSGRCRYVLSGHPSWVVSLAFSPNGLRLAVGTENTVIWVWDLASEKHHTQLCGHTLNVRSVAFHPGGAVLASGSEDQTIRLWDVATGVCLQTLRGHDNRVRTLVYTPNGQVLISASNDRTIRCWDVPRGTTIAIMEGHTDWITAVALSEDGRTLVSGSYDETVRVWDAVTHTCQYVLRGERPYERMDITGVHGLTDEQRAALITLGAVTRDESNPTLVPSE